MRTSTALTYECLHFRTLGFVNLRKLKLKVIFRVNVVIMIVVFVAAKIRRVVTFKVILHRSRVEIGLYNRF